MSSDQASEPMLRVGGRLRSTGAYAEVAWHNGRLSGDIDAVLEIRVLLQAEGSIAATVTGPFHRATNDPRDGWWVLPTLREPFEWRGLEVEGSPPGHPPDTSIPPGTVS